jgi:hypothetical protein
MNELGGCEADSARTERSWKFWNNFEMRSMSHSIPVVIAPGEVRGSNLGNSQEMQ